MNEIYATALEVQNFCENRKWKFCVIGGVAVHRWGEVRVTMDLDLIRAELKPLLELKGEPENAERLEKLIARHSQPFKLIKPALPESGTPPRPGSTRREDQP